MKRSGGLKRAGYTITETVVASTVFTMIMGAVVLGSIALQRGFARVEGFTVAQMHLPDVIAMDARRGYTATPTLVNTTYTLPLTILTPAVYKPDGKTMMDPARTYTSNIVTVKGGKSGKNPHNFKRISYPLSYGTTGTTPTTTVTYSMAGSTVFRTVGASDGIPGVSRPVATGVESITFDTPDYDMTDPDGYILTCRIKFLKSAATLANSAVDSLLVTSFLVRGDFYDNDHD